jgi:[ribosomal protein S5]-alanine N-acetyltransferase
MTPKIELRMGYFLTSMHLGFRCWHDSDLPLAMELWGDPKVSALIGGPFNSQMVRSRLTSEITHFQEHGLQYWPFFLLDNDTHVGCAGFRLYNAEQYIYEFGVHLRPAFWKRGLAKEAAKAIIEYGFDVLGAEALFAEHHPANESSRTLLLSLGFVHSHEELYRPTGLIHPSYMLRQTHVDGL